MLKLLPHVEAAILLAAMVGMYYSALSLLPSPQLFFYQYFLLKQSEVVLAKSVAEAFSYEYFLEVNASFDPGLYSDETSEQWDVPTYFVYPPGGTVATCSSVDGKIGCTVWNLDNNGDVCPVVVSYTPNPDPTTFIYPTAVDPSDSITVLINKVNNLLGSRGIAVSELNASGTASLIADYYVVDGSYTLRGGTAVDYNSTKSFSWTIKPGIKSSVGQALCVCDGSVVATYDVNAIYLSLEGNLEGVPMLRESTLFLRYFLARTSYNTPSTVNQCEMVFT